MPGSLHKSVGVDRFLRQATGLHGYVFQRRGRSCHLERRKYDQSCSYTKFRKYFVRRHLHGLAGSPPGTVGHNHCNFEGSCDGNEGDHGVRGFWRQSPKRALRFLHEWKVGEFVERVLGSRRKFFGRRRHSHWHRGYESRRVSQYGQQHGQQYLPALTTRFHRILFHRSGWPRPDAILRRH